MNTVQPIRDKSKIIQIQNYLKLRSQRNYIFFCLGIYSGLRVSDLLKLTVGKVRNQTHIALIPEKTKRKKKKIRFTIHQDLIGELDQYIQGMDDKDYLFPSRQRKKLSGAIKDPFDRTTAYKMLNNVARVFDITDIGCHTMRKTWGYHLYKDDPANLALLMEMFGHEDLTSTLRYLGLTQDAMDSATRRLSYT
jgi:integrase